jgi:hypothetical protein
MKAHVAKASDAIAATPASVTRRDLTPEQSGGTLSFSNSHQATLIGRRTADLAPRGSGHASAYCKLRVDPTSTVKKARLYRFGEGAQQLNDNRRAFGGPYFPAAESASIGLARGRSANRRRAKHRARLAPCFATIKCGDSGAL